MIDNKEVQAYLKKALSGQVTDKKTKQKVDASKWKDAFNSKGSVNNKQEYLDLLLSYIRNSTSFNGLTEKYAGTINGQIDRLKGNWETLKADLLGIDANNTGMIKPGQVTVFSAIKEGLDSLDNWLKSDSAKSLLDKIGSGLGQAVESISKAFQKLLENGSLEKIGDVFIKLGNSIAKMIDKLDKSGVLNKFVESLPDLAERAIGSKAVDTINTGISSKDAAQKNWVGTAFDGIYGYMKKARVELGTETPEEATKDLSDYSEYSTGQKIMVAMGMNPNWQWSLNPDDMLSDKNAYQVLANNSHLTGDQRKQIKDMMDKDNASTYNVTIGTIQADNFDQIVDSLNKHVNNK